MWPSMCGDCRNKQAAEYEAQQRVQEQLRREHKLRENLSRTIPRRYEKACLDDLPDTLRKLFENLIPTEGAYLYGATGVGKTYSLCAVARELVTQGYWVKRIVWERLTLEIRGSFRYEDVSEQEIIQPLIDCDILIIEDLGTSTSADRTESDFNLRVLLTILDARNEDMRPTWISSNKSIEQLAETFDDRVASRLCEHCKIILLEGKDRRRK